MLCPKKAKNRKGLCGGALRVISMANDQHTGICEVCHEESTYRYTSEYERARRRRKRRGLS